MLLSILALRIKSDNQNDNQSVTFYYRVGRQLKSHDYPLANFNDLQIELNNIHLIPQIERQKFVCRLLSMSNDRIKIHSDYHLWLMIIRRWYQTRNVSSVYLYAIILSFIRSVFIIKDNKNNENVSIQQIQVDNLLSIPFDINRFRKLIKNKTREKIFANFHQMIEYSHRQKTFNVNIIHEFNCLQTTLMIAWQINEFFDKPFSTSI